VYKKRVYELCATQASAFWIDIAGHSWDQDECPLASSKAANRLLAALTKSANYAGDGRNVPKRASRTENPPARRPQSRLAEKGAEGNPMNEILHLLSLQNR
jgi:hypothetical protein